MWEAASIFFVGLSIASIIGTEVLRSIMETRRRRRRGYGGTTDIAIVGIVVFSCCTIATVICFVKWLHFVSSAHAGLSVGALCALCGHKVLDLASLR